MASEQQNKVNKVTEAGEEEYALAAKDAGIADVTSDLDDVMDAIDEVLEAHTEEEAALFVASYQQKGGQ